MFDVSIRSRGVRLSFASLVVCTVAVLSACGGGGGGSPAAVPAAVPAPVALSVSAVTSAGPLSYGKLLAFDVMGTSLDQGVAVSAPGCTGLVEVANSTSTQKRYTCTLSAAGNLVVDVKSSMGSNLFNTVLAVPDPQVTLVTSAGTMVLELNPANAPLSVNNFLKYTNDGFYSNLIFHRVISTFVIQAGGFSSGLVPKATTYAPIKLESANGLKNLRGTLAMARTSAADSATSQFYLNLADNPALDYASASQPGYAVFGKVIQGLPVMDAIRVVPTGARGGITDVPVADVTILSATQTR